MISSWYNYGLNSMIRLINVFNRFVIDKQLPSFRKINFRDHKKSLLISVDLKCQLVRQNICLAAVTAIWFAGCFHWNCFQ